MLPHAPRTSFLIRDWEGCTTATNELPNPNQRSVVKTSGFLHPYIYRYTARVPRDRFLAFEGEGMTWMRQPSRQGIALFSARMEFWRSTGLWLARSACQIHVAALVLRSRSFASGPIFILRVSFLGTLRSLLPN